jgi:hypothetical protein
MTSFVEKTRKAREQRMEKQVIDYNAWLDGFMKTTAWTYFKRAFDVGVVEDKNKNLERKYLDKILNLMLKAIFFSITSDYKDTRRYKSYLLDKENTENALEMKSVIKSIQKIRNRTGFKSSDIEQKARLNLFLWLNGIDELTHDLADDIESNPDNFVASDKLDILDKVFGYYQTSLNGYLDNNSEYRFADFHCICFNEPIPVSKIKKILDTSTALTIYFHDLLSRSVNFANGNGYPQTAPFYSLKGVGWTVPAKLVLAATSGINITAIIDDPELISERSKLVEKTKDKAKKFVQTHSDFTIRPWTLNYEHS